jgi:hypothetical protein
MVKISLEAKKNSSCSTSINLKCWGEIIKSLICFSFFLLVFCFNGNSQGQSYNTDYSSFADGSAATNNVNLYTGTLNVNIPIKTFNIRGYQLPISLTYDGSGVRVVQHPSWVGQNWNLACGGAIVRVLKNKVDEYSYKKRASRDGSSTNEGYINSLNYFNNCTSSTLKSCSLQQIADSASLKGYDFEPDEFIFNFMGYSGTFLLGNDGQWKVKSNSHIQVLFDVKNETNYCDPLIDNYQNTSTSFPKVIAGFTLKANDGTTYYFGYNNNAVEYEQPFFGSSSIRGQNVWIASAWYLTRVVDRFNNEVYNLRYSRGAFTANLYRNDGTIDTPSEIESSVTLDPYTPERSTGSNYCPTIEIHTNVIKGRLTSPVYLESVYSNDILLGKFNTESSNENNYSNSAIASNSTYASYGLKWMKLSSITIPSDSVNVVFSYNDIRGLVNRLCLENISLKSYSKLAPTDINNNATYTFRYNNFDLIPDYLSTCFDAWGYCSTPFTIDKSNLDKFKPNFNFEQVRCGSLIRITYPNGKYSLFDYEPHEYSSFVNRIKNIEKNRTFSFQNASGLRIKKIYDYDGVNMKYRYYTYLVNRGTINQIGSGILYSKPRYYEKDEKSAKVYFSINGLAPLASNYDYFISYSQVQENNQDESYVDYSFTNLNSNMDKDPQKLYYIPNDNDRYTDLSYQRGLVTEQKSYNASGSLTGYVKNKYIFNQIDSVKSSNLLHDYICDGTQVYTGGVYYYMINKPLLSQTIEHKIIGSKSYVTELTYTYKYFKNYPYVYCINNSTQTSTEKTLFTYSFDVNNNDNLNLLVGSFVTNEPIKTIYYKNGKLSKILQKSFSNINGKILQNSIVQKNYAGILNKSEFSKYDEYGNIIESKNANGISNLVVYGYDFKYPVIECHNIDYSKFNDYITNKGYTLGDIQKTIHDNQTKAMFENILDGFTAKFPQSSICCSIYKNGFKFRQYSDKDKFVDYDYDHYLRLKTIKNKDGNILKAYNYNFSTKKEYDGLYYNTKESKIFIKNNCESSKVGGKYLHILEKGHFSSKSKEELDIKVSQELSDNPIYRGGQYFANTYGTCNKPYARIALYPSGEYKYVKDAWNRDVIVEQHSDIVLFFYTDPYSRMLFNPKTAIPIILNESHVTSEFVTTRIGSSSGYSLASSSILNEGVYYNKTIMQGNCSDSVNILLKSRLTRDYKEIIQPNTSDPWISVHLYDYSFGLNSSNMFSLESKPEYFYNSPIDIKFDKNDIPGYKQIDCNLKIPEELYIANTQDIANQMAADSAAKFKVKYPFFNTYIKSDGIDFDVLNFDKEGNGYSQNDSNVKTDTYYIFKSMNPWINWELYELDNKKYYRIIVDKNISNNPREGSFFISCKDKRGYILSINKFRVVQD